MANNSSRPPLTSSAATSTEPWLQLCLSGAGEASSYPITSADTPRRSDSPTAALRPQCPSTPSSTVPAPSSPGADLRVVKQPGGPAAGLWLSLRPAGNQIEEPSLPQLPKSYIRIKDGRMPVKLLMKYLAKKLGLGDESEIEITCRGQPLLPFSTLQGVRDHLWCAQDMKPPSVAECVMTLHYGRRSIYNLL
ncbi:hypothetical protein HPP92_007019 [Vanilla planifolia]|uniref:Uncharacterized protein n=1 Tax=Vanilla planifolia TaxID=51239 RepID=A0A835RL12_VANPL|nr:hypothetical protein HPP92_007019 [Vanilla planifolia]